MKGIDNILKPLYDLWHKVMDKLSVKNDVLLIDGKEVVVKMIVNNIKQLSDSQCNELQCGDVVAKKTGNMFHLYQVTYKEDKHGICLTYQAAGLQETQSYDYIEGHWVYNSEDVVNTGGHTDAEVKALAVDAVEEATSGTVAEIIGLDSSGNMVKGTQNSKLYLHNIRLNKDNIYFWFKVYNSNPTPYTLTTFKTYVKSVHINADKALLGIVYNVTSTANSTAHIYGYTFMRDSDNDLFLKTYGYNFSTDGSNVTATDFDNPVISGYVSGFSDNVVEV